MTRKAFLLRMDPRLFRELERWAGDDFRSVNGQIEYLLQRAVQGRQREDGDEAAKRRKR